MQKTHPSVSFAYRWLQSPNGSVVSLQFQRRLSSVIASLGRMGHRQTLFLNGLWDMIACTASVHASVNKRLSTLLDAKESERNVESNLRERTKNPPVELKDGLGLTVTCRSAHLERLFRTLFDGFKVKYLTDRVIHLHRSEGIVFISQDIGLPGKFPGPAKFRVWECCLTD
jgi:hypothetical protein